MVSVVYLGLQIADNNKLLRSQGHYNALSLAQRPLEMMVESESLADVVVRCDEDPAAVSVTDWRRCSTFYFMQFNAWEYMYYQHRYDAIPRQLWVGADSSFKQRIATRPGYAAFWAEYQTSFDQPFRDYADAEFRRTAPGQAR